MLPPSLHSRGLVSLPKPQGFSAFLGRPDPCQGMPTVSTLKRQEAFPRPRLECKSNCRKEKVRAPQWPAVEPHSLLQARRALAARGRRPPGHSWGILCPSVTSNRVPPPDEALWSEFKSLRGGGGGVRSSARVGKDTVSPTSAWTPHTMLRCPERPLVASGGRLQPTYVPVDHR